YDNESNIDTSSAAQIQQKYGIADRYIIYPSVTWKHKNHLNLMRALKWIIENWKLKITLVCTGSKNDFYPVIEAEIKKLGLEKNVIFTGFIPETDLKVLLKKSAAVVIPTLYEAESIPLIEAMALGAPVVCSNATVLPEQIGSDARFIFDPHNPEDMAQKIYNMISDENLRQENMQNSAKQMEKINWQNKITNFTDSYRGAIEKKVNVG
ncbi:MAG: glycosyltransferase family 1 protein, partial [Candidatus Staskawiczbacteria bacterium]|nr:glycosyltransferase family 1 protein [Candidatus Staskawiczbacteria bacterium]